MLTPDQAQELLKEAEPVCSASAVVQAVRRVATEISDALAALNPLVLTVMGGAVIFAGQLLPLLRFPLTMDYLHVTRYGRALSGGSLEWKVFPAEPLAGRVVLVLDDILDEGHTMVEIRRRILGAGARQFYAAVLADKDTGKMKPITADFVGISVPDRYLFGFGMDVKGAWRNLPAIYALNADSRIPDPET